MRIACRYVTRPFRGRTSAEPPTLDTSPQQQSTELTFDNEAHRAAYEQVAQWVGQLFGESASVSPERPTFFVPLPDAFVMVGVQPMTEDAACVDLWTHPCGEERPHDGLHRHLLELNATYRFGDLNLQEDGSLIYERIEPMETLTKEWFSTILYVLANSSAEIAEDLKESQQRLGSG